MLGSRMKHTKTDRHGGWCRVCGTFLPKGTECYKGKKRNHVCDECYDSIYIDSPDNEMLIEAVLVLPDGSKVPDYEIV